MTAKHSTGAVAVNLEAAIDSFIEDYEMLGETEDGRDAYYTPNDNDRALLRDAIMGLLSDDDFVQAWNLDLASRPAAVAAEAEPDGYLFLGGYRWHEGKGPRRLSDAANWRAPFFLAPAAAPPSAPAATAEDTDEIFRGSDAALIDCMRALVNLDARGALAPHGIGGHARSLLLSAAERLARLTSAPQAEGVTDAQRLDLLEAKQATLERWMGKDGVKGWRVTVYDHRDGSWGHSEIAWATTPRDAIDAALRADGAGKDGA